MVVPWAIMDSIRNLPMADEKGVENCRAVPCFAFRLVCLRGIVSNKPAECYHGPRVAISFPALLGRGSGVDDMHLTGLARGARSFFGY